MTDFVHVTGSERTSGEHPPGPEPAVIPMVNPALLSAYQARLLDPATATANPGVPSSTHRLRRQHALVGAPPRVLRTQSGPPRRRRFSAHPGNQRPRPALCRRLRRRSVCRRARLGLGTRLTLVHIGHRVRAARRLGVLESARAHRVVGRAAPSSTSGPPAAHRRSVGTWGSVGGTWGSVGGTWGSVGGTWGSVGGPISEYGAPGFGGRTPVSWAGTDPYRQDPDGPRAPTVVVLDTGLGDHPWFRNERGYRSTLAVSRPPGADPEAIGVVTDPLNGMVDPDAGHGTFIAGMIRQRCPGAHIAAVAVTPASGAP